MALTQVIEQARRELGSRSGKMFYSGRAAFEPPRELYVLGFNPGGSPTKMADQTIANAIDEWEQRTPVWSAYLDQSWSGRAVGDSRLQRRVKHMFQVLGLDLRAVPAGNVIFVRTAREADLTTEGKTQLLATCWRVHAAVIQQLGIRTILCFGGTAGRWCREQLGTTRLFGRFREQNNRGWTSEAHFAVDGRAVVTVTHPSVADWCVPATDPTPLVRAVLARDFRIPARMPLTIPESPDEPLSACDVPSVDASWSEIGEFALTYNGYEVNGSFEACAVIANARQNQTIDDLRTCLFFEQRSWRHAGDALTVKG